MNVCNFAKAEPALVVYDDARTLFHEFGHALHQMLSNVTYESVSGTSVARDFVELPSQLYEHWLDVPEVLAEFAAHAETGEPMPRDCWTRCWVRRPMIWAFQRLNMWLRLWLIWSFMTGRSCRSDGKAGRDSCRMGMPAAISMRHATPQFAHVFSGDGYSAGITATCGPR